MAILYEAKWTAATLKAHKAAGGYFAGPGGTYPLKDASDVADAWGLAGQAADPDQVRRNIINWAKDNGHTDALPDTAKAFMAGKKEESAPTTVSSSIARPQKKIATLRVCFLEYNARSLNGRIYPKATCDAIYKSAIAKLAASESLPITCFVSHETANSNVNTDLVGRVVKVWQEGAKFYADIDLADTRVARDMLALTEGGYMRSESMRVLGVELLHDRNYDLPLVVVPEGIEPELLGIDLTTRPGLMDTARINAVLYESAQGAFDETFALVDDVRIESKEEIAPAMDIPIYLKIALGELAEGVTPDRAAHQRVHDHLAGVLDEALEAKHGRSAKIAPAGLNKDGRSIAQKHATRLAAAHDESAKVLGMDCEGVYDQLLGAPDHQMNAPSDTDNDGDDPANGFDPDNDGESHNAQKGNQTDMELTETQMIEALKAKGYDIPEKKTPEQVLQEAIDAKLAEQERKFEEKLNTLMGNQTPQRQSLALGSGLEESSLKPEEMYQEGDYLRGDLHPKNWRALSDRRVPWPASVDPKEALSELAPFLAFRLNSEEAHARGRDISQFIDQYEQV